MSSDAPVEYTCSIGDCKARFYILSSFGNHLRRDHSNRQGEVVTTVSSFNGTVGINNEAVNCNANLSDSDVDDNGTVDSGVVDFGEEDEEDEEDELQNLIPQSCPDRDTAAISMMTEFIDDVVSGRSSFSSDSFFHVLLRMRLNLLAKNVALSTVRLFFNQQRATIGGIFSLMQASAPNAEALDWVKEVEANIGDAFSEVDTEYKMRRRLVSLGLMVPPKSITLGTRWDLRPDRETGRVKHVQVPNTFQYVSPLDVLEFILKHPEVQEVLDQQSDGAADGFMRDFTDGKYFKRHPFFSVNIRRLRLLFFFDDFEVSNPLGPRAGDHKIGAVYFTILNMPVSLRSCLSSCFMSVLFHSYDRNTYGFETVLQPLVDRSYQSCNAMESL